jgi:PAS domain S-box-containing protein
VDNRVECLRTALNLVGDGVIISDAAGSVTAVNPVAAALTGWPPHDAAGQPLARVVHVLDEATRELAELPSPGSPGRRLLATRGGAEQPVEIAVATVTDSAGAAAGAVVLLRKLANRGADAAGDFLYEEARRVGEQLRQRNEELAAAARRKDEFLAMLAHELRSPLAPISNGLHILKLPAVDPGLSARARDMMERQINNLTRIVDDLLEVSRLTRGRIELRVERLDLARLVRDAVEDRRADFERAGLTVELGVPDVPAWVAGDPTRLTQVLDNLLDNARKFTSPGGRVTVGVEQDGSARRAALTVTDTGAGIDPELLPWLFDAFSQADRSLDRSQGGLGLGLALVKGLVELHGGQVRANSAGRGHGAEFRVTLPACPEPAALSGLPSAPHRARRRLRILVVEDNRDSAETLRMLLQMFGHEVTVAHSGTEGVEAAKRLHPEVVLCDIGLPGLDGYGVVGELRRDPDTAGARVIAVTGYGAEEDRRRSQQAGFDMHLTKPLDPDALQEAFSEEEAAPPEPGTEQGGGSGA